MIGYGGGEALQFLFGGAAAKAATGAGKAAKATKAVDKAADAGKLTMVDDFLSRHVNPVFQQNVKNAFADDIKVAIVASILPLIIQHILPQGIWTFFIVIFVALLSTIITIYGLGLMKEERHYVNDLIKTKIIRHIWIKKS